MSKSDEYRANAEECQKMARIATNPGEKVTWLEMAADWLRMIKPPRQTPAQKFDAAEHQRGTGQEKSQDRH